MIGVNPTSVRAGLEPMLESFREPNPTLDSLAMSTASTPSQSLANAIDDSRLVVVAVTRRYVDKVNGVWQDDQGRRPKNNNCRLEFAYSNQRKDGISGMLPVVLDRNMRDTKAWESTFGMVLGQALYVDLTSEPGQPEWEKAMEKLLERIVEKRRG